MNGNTTKKYDYPLCLMHLSVVQLWLEFSIDTSTGCQSWRRNLINNIRSSYFITFLWKEQNIERKKVETLFNFFYLSHIFLMQILNTRSERVTVNFEILFWLFYSMTLVCSGEGNLLLRFENIKPSASPSNFRGDICIMHGPAVVPVKLNNSLRTQCRLHDITLVQGTRAAENSNPFVTRKTPDGVLYVWESIIYFTWWCVWNFVLISSLNFQH